METRDSIKKRGLKFSEEAINQLAIKSIKLLETQKKEFYKELNRRKTAKKLRKKQQRLNKLLGVKLKKGKIKIQKTIVPTKGEEYKVQYEHPLWRKRRSEILLRDNNCCTKCGCKHSLQVHHLIYQFGFNLWEYKDEYLTTVCQNCHEQIHKETPIGLFYNKGTPLEKHIIKL